MPEKAADDAAKMGGTTLGCVPVKDVLSRGRFCFRYKEVGKMPIKIQHDLPAREILNQENIFVMDETRAIHQDIRPTFRSCRLKRMNRRIRHSAT